MTEVEFLARALAFSVSAAWGFLQRGAITPRSEIQSLLAPQIEDVCSWMIYWMWLQRGWGYTATSRLMPLVLSRLRIINLVSAALAELQRRWEARKGAVEPSPLLWPLLHLLLSISAQCLLASTSSWPSALGRVFRRWLRSLFAAVAVLRSRWPEMGQKWAWSSFPVGTSTTPGPQFAPLYGTCIVVCEG